MDGKPLLLRTLVEEKRPVILDVVRAHTGRSVSLVGSVARDDTHANSDIDLLVEFEPSSSLLDLIDMEEALREVLGVHVDVISVGALLERDSEIRRDRSVQPRLHRRPPVGVLGTRPRCRRHVFR